MTNRILLSSPPLSHAARRSETANAVRSTRCIAARRCAFVAGLVFSFAPAAWAFAPAAWADETLRAIQLADGSTFRATLQSAGEGTLVFSTAAETKTVAIGDLVRYGAPPEPQQGSIVVLAGGDRIVGTAIAVDNDRLSVDIRSDDALAIPLALVRGLLLRIPRDSQQLDQQLRVISSQAPAADVVLLDNDDRIRGTVRRLSPDQVVLQSKAGEIRVPRARARAVLFQPTGDKTPQAAGPRLLVGLRGGSRITVTRLTTEKGVAQMLAVSGLRVRVPIDRIASLQTVGGRALYLSDLAPKTYRHIPLISIARTYQADRNAAGGALRAGGRRYEKGIGMVSASQLTYELARPAARFEALLAVDDYAGRGGSVQFRVYVDDGTGSWKPRYESPIVRGGQTPVPVSVDLRGAKRVSLLVDFADGGSVLDYADWLDARLIP